MIRKRLIEPGFMPTLDTPADFQGFVKSQVGTLQPVVKAIRVVL